MKKQVYKIGQWDILEDKFLELFRKIYIIKKKKNKGKTNEKQNVWILTGSWIQYESQFGKKWEI